MKTDRIFFRIETNEDLLSKRIGPYHDNAALDYMAMIGGTKNNNVIHPSPRQDSLLSDWWKANTETRRNYKFGFISTKQYLDWFFKLEGRKRLVGFAVLAVYLVPKNYIKLGEKQAIAHGEHMVHLKDVDPHTLEFIEGSDFALY